MSPAARAAPRQRVIAAPPPTLCLDFVNTRYWRGRSAPTETLVDVASLAGWLQGAVDAQAAAGLKVLARSDAGAARRLFDTALEWRESLHGLLRAIVDASPLRATEVEAFGRMLHATPARHDPVLQPEPAGWRVTMHRLDVAELLAPVLWSAADLALGSARARLRCCANEACGWLFLDDSKAGTRRWCSMSDCGNRAKARRHGLRQRERARADPAAAAARPPRQPRSEAPDGDAAAVPFRAPRRSGRSRSGP